MTKKNKEDDLRFVELKPNEAVLIISNEGFRIVLSEEPPTSINNILVATFAEYIRDDEFCQDTVNYYFDCLDNKLSLFGLDSPKDEENKEIDINEETTLDEVNQKIKEIFDDTV